MRIPRWVVIVPSPGFEQHRGAKADGHYGCLKQYDKHKREENLHDENENLPQSVKPNTIALQTSKGIKSSGAFS